MSSSVPAEGTMPSLSIIIAGATGAIGRELVAEAVASDRINRVVALSRRAIPSSDWQQSFPRLSGGQLEAANGKLTVVGVDWERMHSAGLEACDESVQAGFAGHHIAAMCMGSTRKDAGSAAAFRHCDYDFVQAFARAVRTASAPTLAHYSQVSSTGANATSWFLYMKTKGEADEMAVGMGFPSTAIWRPGLLDRGKEKARFHEKIANAFMTGMPVQTVARAMLHRAIEHADKQGGEVGAAPQAPVYFADAQIRVEAAKLSSSL